MKNSFLTLFFAYGIGVPLAAVICFPGAMGLRGLWLGISIANFFLVLIIYLVIKDTNWDSLAAPHHDAF